ncbi:hypothetical protein [Litorihabitans aurantiacus]|uniref:Uncharacterized protein n=1 Tax=Litorihabitans aurantiacus TaxID=1930061 RepID=A0AA37XGV9_9MICO|nr:hypothetical protein [Litorihabitans aurantiacus]GMA33226.1 hypothetical protein GCM10025875_32180 [Litorihabitans aurantiacus]
MSFYSERRAPSSGPRPRIVEPVPAERAARPAPPPHAVPGTPDEHAGAAMVVSARDWQYWPADAAWKAEMIARGRVRIAGATDPS